MAQLNKPSDDDKAWFDELLPTEPDVLRRPMFGQLAGFVNGNMFLCLFGPRVAVRLGDTERAELLAVAGAEEFAPMPGRPMKEYVVLPPTWHGKGKDAQRAVERALAYARATRPDTLTAITVASSAEDARALQAEWAQRGIPVPLTELDGSAGGGRDDAWMDRRG